MILLKRIWIACLLAIAGGGQLPLWLHRSVCHCCPANAGADCTQAACATHDACQSQSSNPCAYHNHGGKSARAPAIVVAQSEKSARHTLSISASSSGHENCAACYSLSQPTLMAAFCLTAHSTSYVPLARPTPEQLPEFDLLSAYSSRAPPSRA